MRQGPDSLAEEALEFGESEVSAGAAPWADDYSVAAVTAVQGVISIRQDNYLFYGRRPWNAGTGKSYFQ